MVNAVVDNNVEDEHEAWFQADEMTDAWESEQLNQIDPALITAAKKKDLEQIHAGGTFEVCRREDLPEGTKVIGSRWVLVDKGPPGEPKVKARLVGQEFATHKDIDL